jgi:hypothetical protein
LIGFLTKYLTQILGGALAVSLLGNVFFGIMANRYADKAAQCKANVVAVNKIATAEKKIVEARQDKVKNEKQVSITARISNATQRVRDDSRRQSDLPRAANSSGSIDAAGTASELLPPGSPPSEVEDQVICTTNTILAEEWQDWYLKQVEIRKDQSVDTNR